MYLENVPEIKKESSERTGSLKCGTGRIPALSENHSLRTSSPGILPAERASLTVEAALVMPILLFCLVTLISFMDIYRLQAVHLNALCDKAMKEGVEAYSGGSGEEISVSEEYYYTPLQTLFPLPAAALHTTVKVRPWTGRDGAAYDVIPGGRPEKMVYMAVTGKVIHLDPHCSYLDIHYHAVSGSSISERQNAEGEHYRPCELCSRGQKPQRVVYVTEHGERYHNSGTCSGLKRTVRLIPESRAGTAALCSRCGGG